MSLTYLVNIKGLIINHTNSNQILHKEKFKRIYFHVILCRLQVYIIFYTQMFKSLEDYNQQIQIKTRNKLGAAKRKKKTQIVNSI